MVSTLFVDVLPLLEPELVLELEPALQPAASRPAVRMTPYLVRRLMPLRPYCRVWSEGTSMALLWGIYGEYRLPLPFEFVRTVS